MVDLHLPRVDGSGGRSFGMLVAGSSLPPNPGELVESHAMETLLEQAKAKYDLIVVDTPPLTAVSDAFPVAGLAELSSAVGAPAGAASGGADRAAAVESICEHVFVWSPK
jgi:Mrp family chromosome partitioning ATPase